MQRHVSVVHVVMGWSWVSLSTLRPSRPTSAYPSLAPAAVLLQMKLPARKPSGALYSHILPICACAAICAPQADPF